MVDLVPCVEFRLKARLSALACQALALIHDGFYYNRRDATATSLTVRGGKTPLRPHVIEGGGSSKLGMMVG